MRVLLIIILFLAPYVMRAQRGMPFVRNYGAAEYGAHNRNFDIVANDDGTVVVANFEGLLYYDQAQWHILHTPGITRITALKRDSKGTIWVGGYNYIGCLTTDDNGSIALRSIGGKQALQGEVERIWESGGKLQVQLSGARLYVIEGQTLMPLKQQENTVTAARADEIEGTEVAERMPIADGMTAVATRGKGVIVCDSEGKELYRLDEGGGLCSDYVNSLDYDAVHGLLWGATDRGVFAVAVASSYTHFTQNDGLRGEVLTIGRLGRQLYVGTMNGLFRLEGMDFVPVCGISHACWQLARQDDNLLAATMDGVFSISADGKARQLATAPALSLLVDGAAYYTGEMDGVYLNLIGGGRQKMGDIEKVVKMMAAPDDTIWLQNLYGGIWKGSVGKGFRQQGSGESGGSSQVMATLVMDKGRVSTVTTDATKPFPYPLFSYNGGDALWLTDNKGKNLYVFRNGHRDEQLSQRLHPLSDYSVQAVLTGQKLAWIGGEKGLVLADLQRQDPMFAAEPKLRLRSVVLHDDSVLWGGVGDMPGSLPALGSDEHHLDFYFSLDNVSLVGNTLYRYRLNNGSWTAWDESTNAPFNSLSHGIYTLEMQGRDALGRLSEVVAIEFSIDRPFYLRWYMYIVYALLLAVVIMLIMQWRMRRLEKETQRLESIVEERTAKLREAQHELIRQEKMATVGKLTQGLIDRILNPLNYINNFAKLSEGLVRDIESNIEDDHDAMDPDNYEDTVDVLGMLKGNLQKVSEHGQNTTRTLKAMEEVLKDRSGGIVSMNLAAMLRQDHEMMCKYYAEEIARYHIDTRLVLPDGDLSINGNADQLSKTVMSFLGNAVYAIVRKAQRQQFQPEVTITVAKPQASVLTITIRDNGIGIEPTIIDKVFDPFFTTKPTGEAAGVGLYLSREIVQNHGGDITVNSVKDVFTEFVITLPATE